MNLERFAGICKQTAGTLTEAWGELVRDPLRAANGRRMQVSGTLQQRHGYAMEESSRQLREFLQRNRNWRF